jgi:L-arabinose isomerase
MDSSAPIPSASGWLPSARRVATVAMMQPFWGFWQHAAPGGHAQRRAAQMERLRSSLQRECGEPGSVLLVSMGLCDVDAIDEALVDRLSRCDALLIVVTMAAPPGALLEMLRRLPRLPLVLCAFDDSAAFPEDFDHADITARGATVGLPMLTSLLTRSNRPHSVVFATLDDAASMSSVAAACSQASQAGRITTARLGRVGAAQHGYVHVDASDSALTDAFGLTVVRLSPDELVERYRSVDDDAVDVFSSELERRWTTEPAVNDDMRRRTIRAGIALRELVRDHQLDAGSINCHIPEIRLGSEIGIAPCFALGMSTSEGVPWTCTGDVLTAVAMLVAQVVSGTSLYHELEALDRATGEFVVANTGEHDLGWLDQQATPRLCENIWFRGLGPTNGCCAAYELEPSPATLLAVSFSASGRLRLVTGQGEITGRRFPATCTPNGAFRFSGGPPESAWGNWIRAGVNHHSALARGEWRSTVESISELLGIEHVGV